MIVQVTKHEVIISFLDVWMCLKIFQWWGIPWIKTLNRSVKRNLHFIIWAPSSEFVSSSIPSWQISSAHAQPFRGARDLVFCLKVPLDLLLVWASSEGSGETARIRRLAWTFAARIGDKYQIRLTRSILERNTQIYSVVSVMLNECNLIVLEQR